MNENFREDLKVIKSIIKCNEVTSSESESPNSNCKQQIEEKAESNKEQ